MKKLQLIKEININGETYYWSVYDGERVTPYAMDIDKARRDYDEFKPIEPSKIVIEERNV